LNASNKSITIKRLKSGSSNSSDIERVDIQATERLNRLYIELLRVNKDWGGDDRRRDMNPFMTRLIFCFFAEDTQIFRGNNLFTTTIEKMSDSRSENTDVVISELFRAMDTPINERKNADLPRWADSFPYINSGIFTANKDIPTFSHSARTYLLHAGNLDWKAINPDIFGSMIQAIANDEERGELGMHYTSVPNILKVLNPLFLGDLKQQLQQAGDNPRKLLNLKKRMTKIRVFDPACGSGNFLVIAYKNMREIEVKIHQRRNETHLKSAIPLSNFRGIELKSFPAEIARLALIIAKYQCDALYCEQKEALSEFLPLNTINWIRCGNALRLDWLSVCPPIETNEGGETYICGNPPYVGSSKQNKEQKSDVGQIFSSYTKFWKSLDLVACWFKLGADYFKHTQGSYAFVSTNSICQGNQVAILWPIIYAKGLDIFFAYTSFKWSNLASHNARVTVVIVGVSNMNVHKKKLFHTEKEQVVSRTVENINAYLTSGKRLVVYPLTQATDDRALMIRGNMPTDGGNLLLNEMEKNALLKHSVRSAKFIKKFIGAQELIKGISRYCVWIEDDEISEAIAITEIAQRIESVREMRIKSSAASTRDYARYPHKFRQIQGISENSCIVVARVSSENRDILPVDYFDSNTIVGDRNFVLCDAPLWNMALIASRLHWVWIGTVCVRMRTDFSYSNTLGWNTFPVPKLSEKNKADLIQCAENILLARKAHFPATIAALYKPDTMPENVRQAHQRNDEVLERIYIGRCFKNDTERLEKLFNLYAKMTPKNNTSSKVKKAS